MYEFLGIILKPIIFVIERYYFLVDSILNLPAFSIILTSLSISCVMIPILKFARQYEDKINVKISFIEEQINKIPSKYKGEKKFRATEEIYRKNKFHPIQNIFKGFSLFLLLPILISAYIFFQGNLSAFEVEFLVIKSLAQPDSLLFGVNFLPILIFCINFLDSKFRYVEAVSGKNLYLFISLIVCVLIYNMPSCMTLYWFTSSTFSLLFNIQQNSFKSS
jgi:membrane protein insertase Oxa1/YidC/SpoIIIJ